MEPKSLSKLLKLSLKRARVNNHRSVFVVLGSNVYNQIPVFYELLTRGKNTNFSILCCSENSKKLRSIDWCKKASSIYEAHSEGHKVLPKVTNLQYNDIHDALHQSFNMAVLLDIEGAKPSSLAYIIEAVKGGGIVVFPFSEIKHIEELTCNNDWIKSRFVKRLCASFTSCPSCFILNDKLEILYQTKDTSSLLKNLAKSSDNEELLQLKAGNSTDPISGPLINLCQTIDQAKLFLKLLEALKRRTFHSIVSFSSPKGRGKSATLGLAIAASLALNYSNIFISSSHYDCVKVVFNFLFKGLDVLNFKEDEDYDLIQSVNPKFNNALLGINVFRDHPQAIRFILPGDVENKLEQAELVVIDEAASIPLPLLNRLKGSYVVLMASTIEGCGGAGKFAYEHMVREICQPSSSNNNGISSATLMPISDKKFEKFTLSEPIYYASDDEVEKWINRSLCLESRVSVNLSNGCPEPQQCRLFYVCQEVLFSHESQAEKFLQQLASLFLSSRRTVSPDFLSKIADDSDYHIFCLLSPFDSTKTVSPEILCAVMVHIERKVPFNIIFSGINQQDKLSDCFNEWESISKDNEEFLLKCGIHILDIVTHPECRRMGYGFRTLQLLQEFYDCKWLPIDDNPCMYSISSRRFIGGDNQTSLPLVLQLSEVEPEKVEYLLVSYYLTPILLRFWKKSGFVPAYISREKNSAQEHMCLMMKSIDKEFQPYLHESWRCFCEYYFLLLSSELKYLSSSFALNLLKTSFNNSLPKKVLTKEDIDIYLNPQRMKSLEKYCQNLGDLHCIMPCIPILTKLFFRNFFSGVTVGVMPEVVLLSFGLQHKTIDDISKDLGVPSTQAAALLNRTIKKLTTYLSSIIEKAVEKTIKSREINMQPTAQDLDEDLDEGARKIDKQQLEESKKLKDMDFSQFAIKGSEDEWEKALHSGRKTLVSIKSLKKTPEDVKFPLPPAKNTSMKKKRGSKR